MEYIEGWTLKELMRQLWNSDGHIMPISRTLNLAIQICNGIGYAHRAGLVHCDVKSRNVLVGYDDHVKVTDFGIARAMSETSVRRDDIIWGTPQYFSPEQAAGEPATSASDVYSIGVILFEMLTGRLPFQAESHTALAIKHMQDNPPMVADYNPRVPPQLDLIVNKVLSKEPASRYRTAEQLGRVLMSYRENSIEETGALIDDTARKIAVAEMGTAQFETPALRQPSERPLRAPAIERAPDIHVTPPKPVQGIDWTAVILGVLAIISLLGLIPLWYLVYMRYAG
jgi:serine/threonine-protein kinase